MTAVLQYGVLQSAWLFGKPPFPEFLEPITSFECQVLLCTWFYPRGRTSCPSGCWAPKVHLLKMREVSAAGPCIKAESHSQAELSSCGQQASGVALQLAECSRWEAARWCTAAWGRRSGRSCWPGCSCSLLQRRAAGRPGAAAAAGAAARAALP